MFVPGRHTEGQAEECERCRANLVSHCEVPERREIVPKPDIRAVELGVVALRATGWGHRGLACGELKQEGVLQTTRANRETPASGGAGRCAHHAAPSGGPVRLAVVVGDGIVIVGIDPSKAVLFTHRETDGTTRKRFVCYSSVDGGWCRGPQAALARLAPERMFYSWASRRTPVSRRETLYRKIW